MTGIGYEDLVERLTPDSLGLFREMVETHLASGPGDKLFIRSDSMSGSGMIFSGQGARREWRGFDGGALDDLASYGLIHVNFSSRGTPNYRIGGEALAFHRWLMQQQGSPLEQVSESVQHFVSGPDFAARHPGAAHHLAEAFELIRQGRTDTPVASEIGDHLRKALMDVTTDVVGREVGGGHERPVERLRAFLAARSMSEREKRVLEQLVELADAVLRLDHRLNHLRDEADKGEQPATWEEVRRAAFVTALAAYELSRI